jgi:chemotaxis protein methyltransferase CheR
MPAGILDGGPQLRDAELQQIARLVYSQSGITLGGGKKALVAARLQKRLRAGGFPSYRAYLSHLEADTSGHELSALLDAVATNHTSFFREEEHFGFLTHTVVPPLRARGSIRCWSAACSTGEEPVTLALTLLEAMPGADVRVLASDLSRKALADAAAGVYPMTRTSNIPRGLLAKYFERGLGADDGRARVGAALRRTISYRRMNLLEIGTMPEKYDVIFCRNVMIYFDLPVQQRVVENLERQLAPGGYLFIAHSESLNGVRHHLRWVAPAVYQRDHA